MSSAARSGFKIWILALGVSDVIQAGNFLGYLDSDAWVRVNGGPLVEVPKGKRVEITRESVAIKELAR